jgi:2-oxoisovalerate dehydrogenase E2 component (dihydrolipoyl transacylase)
MSEYIFKLPDLGEGTVESEIAEWFISVGDQVKEEDLVGTMMTDKAAVELSSPISGTVVKLAGEPGDIVAVGAPLVIFETDADVAVTTAPAAPTSTAAVEPQPEPAAETTPPPAAQPQETTPPPAAQPQETTLDRKRVMTSPAIRRRAKDMGIDLMLVPGSGPGGRITRTDFDQFIKRQAAAGAPAAAPVAAERLSAAKREIPHFAYVEEIDITELEALRKHLNGKKADPSERLTLLPFLGLALIRALRDYPQCNTTYDKERNVLLRHGAVHLGIATQTPDGLKVPVVRSAQALSIDALAAEIRRVSQAAKDNSAKKEELGGSTITITSLGKLGGIVSTPVINLPEVAIIGVNRAVERPVVVNGQVAVRLMMNLSSSFDHRFVDGYDAAAMIQSIKEMLEHPATIFLP